MEKLRAYHFTGATLRGGLPIPPVGEVLRHEGKVELCERGLHASRCPFDALQFAPGHRLHLVELGGTVVEGDDKVVASERTILATVDAEAMLRSFARWCALQVIDKWEAPPTVREYLETGNESLSAAASAAAWDAAWNAARDATSAAARDAASAAAWDAAWNAARDAAWNAAWEGQRKQFQGMVDEAFEEVGE